MAEYVVALKQLSTYCEFGDFLNDALQDCLVCGLYKESIQKRLLSEPELTFKKACEITQAMELTDKNANKLHSGSIEAVNTIQNPVGEKAKGNLEIQTPKPGKQ